MTDFRSRAETRASTHRLTRAVLETEAELIALIGEPKDLVRKKIVDRLNPLTRQFILQAPLVCLGTSDAHGNCDVSPRGDPAGFVRILDDATLLLPERPGNRLADSLRNILSNPHVGLLFVIPGVTDTFRVNGRATLTTDAALLEPCMIEGKLPKLGILIDIDTAYTQCSKAFLRSDCWNPAKFIERSALPNNGEILHAIRPDEVDPIQYEAERAVRYAKREGFY